MRYSAGEIARNILAVGLGVAGSIGVFYFLFFATALLPQALNSTNFLMILLGLSCFLGSFCTAAYATRYKFMSALITMILLVVLYIDFFDTNFTPRNYPREWIAVSTIILASVIGGIAGTLPSRASIKKNDSKTTGDS